jgi:hypothetical protein
MRASRCLIYTISTLDYIACSKQVIACQLDAYPACSLSTSLIEYLQMTQLNQISWTAGSDHILCATEGSSRCGDMEIIAFKNNDLILVEAIQAHSATCEKLAVDRRYSLLSNYECFCKRLQ